MSRFRDSYRELSTTEKAQVLEVNRLASELEAAIEDIPGGRYKALAMTSLEEAVMWAIKGITA